MLTCPQLPWCTVGARAPVNTSKSTGSVLIGAGCWSWSHEAGVSGGCCWIHDVSLVWPWLSAASRESEDLPGFTAGALVGDAAVSGSAPSIRPNTKRSAGSSSCSSSSMRKPDGDSASRSKILAACSAVIDPATESSCEPGTEPSRAMRSASRA
eukprot:1855256-Rhodomonas_salina.2